MKTIKVILASLLIVLSTSCNDKPSMQELAVENTKKMLSEGTTFTQLDTIIIRDNLVNVIFKGSYYENDGYFLSQTTFGKDTITIIIASGSKEHCIGISSNDKCYCDYCVDLYEYGDKHKDDIDFKEYNIRKCEKGCEHGY